MKDRSKLGVVAAAAGVAAVSAAILYAAVGRRWTNKWGATRRDLLRTLPGDDIVAFANMNSTRAITIDAEPEDIWPWLVQIGQGRGGLYSYDWLDIAFRMLDRSSVEEILPEYQEIHAGDVIPIGVNDDAMDDFYVHFVDPERALVIGANDPAFRNRVSWSMVLIHEGRNRTRLLVRVRGDVPKSVKGVAMFALLEPASFVMIRKQMLNFKRLAEKTREKREASRLPCILES